MLFEIISGAVFGGIALKAHIEKNGVGNDSKKLNKIFSLSGLNVKDGKETLTTQLLKKKDYEWGTEYRYRIPLGRSFEDYKAKQSTLEAGINVRKSVMTLGDLRELQIDKNIIQSIKGLYSRKLSQRKELELSFDGCLIVRIYNESLPKEVPFEFSTGWKVNLGITREKNKTIEYDFERFPHLALGGATRYGKSNLLNCIITSLLKQQTKNVKLYLIDLKGGVELCDYEKIAQVGGNIAYEPEDALRVLQTAYEDMRKVQRTLKKLGKKKVQDAGIKERHFVIIDEVGELNPDEAITKEEKKLKQECQRYMSQIARLGAGLGFRQILATQYPTGDIIPRSCKQNSDAKLCFRVQSQVASRVVLDEGGAEQLPEIKGRAILQTADKTTVIQTPLINSTVILETIFICDTIKEGRVHHEAPTAKQATRKYTVELEETGLS